MKTFIKVSLYSAIVTTALFQPITSFAQSWEPEKSWDDNDIRNASPSTSKPSSQTPSSTHTNPQSNSDEDSWNTSPSTPKQAPSAPKTDYDKADNSKTNSGNTDNSKTDDTKADNSNTDSGKADNSKPDGNKTSNANRDISPSTPKPDPSTPKANYNSWDAPSTPKPDPSTPKANYDSWDASPSTPKPAPSTPKADYDSWDASQSTSTSSDAINQTSTTNSSYTDVELGDSDFVIRVGGGFTYVYYGSIGAANGKSHRAFHYPGANGNLAFNYCMNSHCIGVDQILATVYTYKGSGNHFLGSTHINYINRHLLTDSFMLEFGAGAGLTYASSSNYKEKRVFAGNGLAISLKLYCIFTYFITRNIGIGVNVAPLGLIELGLNNPEDSSIKHLLGSVGLDAGLHVMLKY